MKIAWIYANFLSIFSFSLFCIFSVKTNALELCIRFLFLFFSYSLFTPVHFFTFQWFYFWYFFSYFFSVISRSFANHVIQNRGKLKITSRNASKLRYFRYLQIYKMHFLPIAYVCLCVCEFVCIWKL